MLVSLKNVIEEYQNCLMHYQYIVIASITPPNLT